MDITITLSMILRYGQRIIVYPAGFADRPREVMTPDRLLIPYEDVELLTKDKVKLRCFLIRKPDGEHANARGTVILFHGNAMDHGDNLGYAQRLFAENFNVFSLEYRGYGHSEGVPSESGLCLDAQAALDYVVNDPVLSKLPIIIYGQSLGGAVAIDVTSKNPDKISALMVENTFTSAPDVIKGFPGIIRYLAFLVTQKWYSANKVSRMPPTLPILMLSGTADQVIPPSHMAKLWKVASTRNPALKRRSGAVPEYTPPQNDVFQAFRYGEHNTTAYQAEYWNTVYRFLDKVLNNNDTPAVE